ncbi:MAG: hypothetical protein DWQ07_07270 [Chloroflexi bacterium]|nr:MAG: hypothetical protein DWQ07_07270 [Chloroflexota bacterium]MBL1195499.1 hypothetical protein [Chloroflexota bacterium]NOH12781.1 hypothetical protein [Chloroflexota bacterium]
MQFFLDSANLDDARRAMELGFVDGVTTNPSLMAAAGRPPLDVLDDLLETTPGPVFFQMTAHSLNEREQDAYTASERYVDRVVIKLPATTENMTLAHKLVADGLLVCITAVSHPSQAMLAGNVGAAYIAPYVNRLTQQMGDGLRVLSDCVKVLEGTSTQVLAASLKSTDEAVAAVLAGASAITIPLDLILAISEHELTYKAIAQFDEAVVLPST